MTKIKVTLRVRPLSEREIKGKFPMVVGINGKSAFITDIRVPEHRKADSRQRLRQFDFDHGFWLTEDGTMGASQEEVYDEIGPPLENSILAGYNACLLAYGRSGSGKTYTMVGTKEDPGLIPRMCQSIWTKLKATDRGKCSFRVEVSFIEIYREKVRDLLTPNNKTLKLREHPTTGPHVQGLTRFEVGEQMLDLLWEGERRRASGTTGSNKRSSRSHAIWTLYLSSTRHDSGLITTNQVHLVDLAGSEKADVITAKNLLAEGKDINRSLVSLGNVISSLAEKAQYIPYRDSALTWLLKDSLGGNAATHIIITASPASCCHAQTLNSLRFAQRARLVENQPKVNISNPSTPGMFPNISFFDIRKDIARLSNIIRSAQANGGILRGLMPRNGWNRLISAIESWNHHSNGEQKRQWPARASSVDTPTTSSSTTQSVSTDAMVQADAERDECFMSAPGSTTQSPSKIPGTEVFIPYSNSIKCLTWRQQEVKIVPKSPSIESDSDDYASPISSPPATMKANYLKYLLPVKYPVSRTLEAESRIGERIHGNFQFEKPEYECVTPKDVIVNMNYPVARDQLPTLVDSQKVPEILQESTSESEFYDAKAISNSKVPVGFKSFTRNMPKFGFEIPEVSEFSKPQPVYPSPFESTDDDESTFECSQNENRSFQSKFRLRRKIESKPVSSSVEEALFFSESSLSSTPTSSCESLKIERDKYLPGNNGVKVVQNCHFDFREVEDTAFGLEIDPQRVEHYTASTISCCSELTSQTDQLKINEMHLPSMCRPLDGASSSKFRNHFVKEFHQMENIGNKIKNLRSMTQRCQIVKPYLNKIAMLSYQDHSKSVAELDAEIDKCSGWNVDIEFQKVQEEIASLNKLLRHGVSKPILTDHAEFNCSLSSDGSVNPNINTTGDSHTKTNRHEYDSYRRISTASSSSQPTSNESYSYHYPSTLQIKSESITPQDQTPQSSSRFYPDSYTHPAVHPGSSTKRSRPILPKTHHYLHHSRIPHNVFSHQSNIDTGIQPENRSDKCSFSSHENIVKSIATRSFSPNSLEHDSICKRDTCNQNQFGQLHKFTFQDHRRPARESFADSRPSAEFSHFENTSTISSTALMKKLSNVRKQLFDI